MIINIMEVKDKKMKIKTGNFLKTTLMAAPLILLIIFGFSRNAMATSQVCAGDSITTTYNDYWDSVIEGYGCQGCETAPGSNPAVTTHASTVASHPDSDDDQGKSQDETTLWSDGTMAAETAGNKPKIEYQFQAGNRYKYNWSHVHYNVDPSTITDFRMVWYFYQKKTLTGNGSMMVFAYSTDDDSIDNTINLDGAGNPYVIYSLSPITSSCQGKDDKGNNVTVQYQEFDLTPLMSRLSGAGYTTVDLRVTSIHDDAATPQVQFLTQEVELAVTTGPACSATAPSDLTATNVQYNQVDLQWTADCTNNDTYTVYRDGGALPAGTNIACTAGTMTFSDTTVAQGTSYAYTVRGYNNTEACESGDSNVVNVTTPTFEPKTTVGTQSATAGDTLINVEATYSDDADSDLVISVYWDTVSGGETNLCGSATHPASPYQVQCTGLTNGNTYYVRVKYSDADGFTNQAGTVYNWDSGPVTPQDISGALIHNSTNLGNSGWPSGWGIAGGQYGEFVCETCHIDPATETTTNIKRIRTQIDTPNTDTWPNGSQLTNTITFTQADGTNSDMGDATGPSYNGVCNVCHDDTKHANYYWNGSNGTHNVGADCTICHKHQAAFAGDGPCKDCHNTAQTELYNTRQVVGAGGDFVKLSRHVSDGTSTEIVTNQDCVVCHAEGDASKVSAGTGWLDKTNHRNGSTATGDPSTDRMVKLRNVDNITQTYDFSKNVLTGGIATATEKETMRTNMDTFCLNCHDTDGSIGIAVTGPSTSPSLTTSPTAAQALTPFNDDDTQENGRDGLGSRTRVIDVKSQFNTGNPSHHAVLGARYSTTDANWTASAWNSTHTLRSGDDISVVRETATLHCSDCHLSESNAHGATNAWHMLLNGVADDFTTDYTMTDALATDDSSIVCYKCHSSSVYTSSGPSAGSRFTHSQDSKWREGRYGGGTTTTTQRDAELGPPCLLCHAGDGFGNIHGVSGTYDPTNPTLPPSGTMYTRYRFMPGAWMQWAPGNGGSDSDWTSASANATCYFPNSSNWSTCTSHSNGTKGTSTNYGRPTTY